MDYWTPLRLYQTPLKKNNSYLDKSQTNAYSQAKHYIFANLMKFLDWFAQTVSRRQENYMIEVGTSLLTDVKQRLCWKKLRDRDNITKGFTLLETLIVVMIMGIMAALATPSWLRFVENQRLFAAQSKIYRVMKQSQNNAMRTKSTWEACFREENYRIQWSVHQPGSDTCAPAGIVWNDLGVSNIQIYNENNDKNECETTLDQGSNIASCRGNGPWRVQFNYLGHVNSRLGQITIVTKNNNQNQRCVYVSTLLGALRKGEKHESANGSNKYCY